ncbi:hypothetical protein LXM25_26695 [Dyadobacter sp. LJ53]|uniref:hypothetical protein n=1 Tax=Dyadobacter chenwenxiniae TaxID=2906456 RepID=UPI001F48792C|nr:hypothetical protein [Dyadobacter chenwenxiniae]MCF0053689.1 hypothetical protein [Dyadobacter chenwenxiniae]
MNFEIIATPHFQREFKKLLKKFPSLHSDILTLSKTLRDNPITGNEVFKNCYKIRFAIKSKGKGKSSGGRLITYVQVTNGRVYLLAIFDKSEKENVTDAYLKQLLKELLAL